MSLKCCLEIYGPISSLTGKKRDYWQQYIERIIPMFYNLEDLDEDILKDTIKNEINCFDEKQHALKPYDCISGEYYVCDETILFEKFIPNQFLACFDIDDIEYTTSYCEVTEDYIQEPFILKTTALKAKSLLANHLKLASYKNLDYIKFENDLLNLISSKSDDSIICLYPGDIYLKSNIEELLVAV